MNPVLILTHNCLQLTKKCVASVRAQDVDTDVTVIDNSSTDGTVEWLKESAIASPSFNLNYVTNLSNRGVSEPWNEGLHYYFSEPFFCDHVLCLNNDTFLPPWFYKELLSYDVPFVTGFPVDTMFEIGPLSARPQTGLTPYPCFSAFLIHRSAWEKIGPFNATMKLYASDCDYHVRAHRLGIPLVKSSTPFYHEPSSTVRNSSPEEQEEFHRQANADRAVFRSLYGCVPGEEPAYSELFK